MLPLTTSSPSDILLGTDSPVRALVSTLDVPRSTIPSIGIFSPGLTSIRLPIDTSEGSTLLTVSFPSSSVTRLAESGLISIRAAMFLRLFPTATDWNSSPIW